MISTHKRILNNFLRIMMIAQQTVSKPIEFRPIGGDQFIEPFSVPFLELSDQFFLISFYIIIHKIHISFDIPSFDKFRQI